MSLWKLGTHYSHRTVHIERNVVNGDDKYLIKVSIISAGKEAVITEINHLSPLALMMLWYTLNNLMEEDDYLKSLDKFLDTHGLSKPLEIEEFRDVR